MFTVNCNSDHKKSTDNNTSTDIMTDTSNHIKTGNKDSSKYFDSSNLKKGFDNIYFGSKKPKDPFHPETELDQLKQIIEKSYPTPERIFEKNSLEDYIRLMEIKNDNKPVPSDQYTYIYLYKFSKNKIIIKVGYEITYEPVYDKTKPNQHLITDYIKGFKPQLYFEDVERVANVERQNKEIEKYEKKMLIKQEEEEAKKF